MTQRKKAADNPKLPKPKAVIDREVDRRAERIWGFVRAHANSLDAERAYAVIAKALAETNEFVGEELKISRAAYGSVKSQYKQLDKAHDSLLVHMESLNEELQKLTLSNIQLEKQIKRMEAQAKARKEE